MAVTTSDLKFTSPTTSEPASPLVAGVVSFRGLVHLFGKTGSNGVSEVETGLMGISSLNDWFARLSKSAVGKSGPTGAWAGEWWAVHNYLQYGGICLVGATGSTGDYYSASGVLGITNTPLHNKTVADIDVIFESGNTFSAGAAVSVATSRQDCIAIIGNMQKISGLPLSAAYTNQLVDFGFSDTSEYVVYVAGRKKFVAGVGSTVNILEADLSPDVAGCFARSYRDASPWYSPAGKTRGRILGVVAMQQNFTETDQSYLYAGNVNPIVVFPGEGTFLMGNKTSYNGTGSLSKINTASLVSYLKKELLASTQKYLFEVNDALTRQRVVSTVTPILQSVLSGNGITNYRIVCDETNNTSEILAQNKLVLDVYIQPTPTAETLVITIINTNTSEAFSG
jgi:hypothetical protein